MANISRRRLARELVRLIAQAPTRRAELLKQAAAYLVVTKRAKQAHLLLSDIAAELLRAQGHLAAEARTAFRLEPATRQQIITVLQKATGAKTIELTETLAPELLGGVVVRTPGRELDTSVALQLKRIAGGIT